MERNDLANLLCPICQRRSVEATATVVWIRGFVLAHRISRRIVIGCVPCARRQLLTEAGRSALIGWFSISALIANPFLILYNLIRAGAVRPNHDAVLKRLQEIGFEPSS